MSDDEVGFGHVEETVKKSPSGEARAAAPGRAQLLVMGRGTYNTHPLPETGTVVIGRAPGSDVLIDDPSISRKHAVLHVGSTIRIEDMGSANGTVLRDRRLASGEIEDVLPGDTIVVGDDWTLIVQLPRSTARPRRLWPHGYFEARLESECARSERTGSSFAVLRIHAGNDADPISVQAAVSSVLRSEEEIAAAYGPGEYELLLVDTTPEGAHEIARAVLRSLHDAGAVDARYGLALFPNDGRAPETLIARACDGVRGVRSEPTAKGRIVIEAPSMQQLQRLIDKVAAGSISVLVLGETGVGKEVAAETIHRRSPRREQPFVRLNCAALSETLIESELFGHERGAFTGALQSKPGLLETAQGGTIFLDEVGELPASTQVKLLRVLEERAVLRVGALKPRTIDVRFVSATNRDLEAEVAGGRFRQDLYFRLNGVSITVPPLRERRVEIDSLAALFIEQVCRQDSRREPALSREALAVLKSYGWPGNIRELRNVIERAVLLANDVILPEHLPLEKMSPAAGTSSTLLPAAPRPRAAEAALDSAKLSDHMHAFERDRIIEALDRCGGNQTQAAKILGIARRTLIKRLDLYQIQRPRKNVGASEGEDGSDDDGDQSSSS